MMPSALPENTLLPPDAEKPACAVGSIEAWPVPVRDQLEPAARRL